jgi:farnesol dehydrogenase
MKIFLTGGSGFIGSKLAIKLAEDNHDLTVLLRDRSKAEEFTGAGIKICYGDLFSKETLRTGMNNCDWVFHLAAFTKPVSKDPGLPYMTNVTGTLNVLKAAKEQSVKKVIITSTAGTMGYSSDGSPVEESINKNLPYHTEYERTKAYSEKAALEFNSDSLEVIIVNPTRVYGPGKLTLSNSVTMIIKLYGEGLWRIIPGNGDAVGNYAFIDDVVNGHVLAAIHGIGGERYILGGENISYREFFNILGDLYNRKRRLFTISKSSLRRIVKIAVIYSKLLKSPAVISNEWIDKYLQDWIVTSDKACKQLNYEITPFREGAGETIQWLRSV